MITKIEETLSKEFSMEYSIVFTFILVSNNFLIVCINSEEGLAPSVRVWMTCHQEETIKGILKLLTVIESLFTYLKHRRQS